MEISEVLGCLLLVSAVGAGLFFVYQKRRKSIGASLSVLENPTPIQSTLSVADSYKKICTLLKNESFASYRWTIKEDNPRGMLIATLTFEEDLGEQRAPRQLILTVSVQEEEEKGTMVRLVYSAYAPFGRTKCDEVLNGTTGAIGNIFSAN